MTGNEQHGRQAQQLRCGCRTVRRWWTADQGTVSAFVVSFVLALLLLSGLVLDGGLALAAKVRANGQAEAAARAGAQAIDLTAFRVDGTLRLLPDQAVANARDYLASVGTSGTVTVIGNTVTVTIITTQPTQLLGLVGISGLDVHGSASAQPQS